MRPAAVLLHQLPGGGAAAGALASTGVQPPASFAHLAASGSMLELLSDLPQGGSGPRFDSPAASNAGSGTLYAWPSPHRALAARSRSRARFA